MQQGADQQGQERTWARVRSLFGEALDRPAGERTSWVRQAASDDPAVVAEVLTLLGHEGRDALDEGGRSRPRDVLDSAKDGPVGSSSTARREVPEALREIGPFRLRSLLGRGGMGAVYEAEQQTPRRLVALKLVRHALIDDELRRRFELEGEVLGRLRHPAIAQTFQTGTARLPDGGEVPYIAMELVPGGRELGAWVAEEDPPLELRLERFCEVVDGVEHAHQQGIVHRDLKPANVLVDEHGRSKIIDFGLARALDSDSGLKSMHTRTGQIMGTPAYMSPEQFSGRPDRVGLASDVYALGVVLYELVSGRLPLDVRGKSVVEAASVVRDQTPRTLRDVTSGTRVRDDLDTIVAKALEKLPERRYETAAALAADVRRYLRDEPVRARPASVLYQARMFARRHRALVVSGTAILLMAVVATAVSITYAVAASRRADEAERASYRSQLLAAVGELEDRNFLAAAEILAHAPERLLGWEHRYLQARLEPGLPVPEALPDNVRVLQRATSGSALLVGVRRTDGMAFEVWDPRTWERRLAVPEASYRVNLVSLSPDGSRLARATRDPDRLRAWDVASGEALMDVDLASLGEPFGVRWSDDGEVLRLVSSRREELRDGRTGALLGAGPVPEHVVRVQFGDASHRLEVDGASVRLLDQRAGDAVVDELRAESAVDLAFVFHVPGTATTLEARHDGRVRRIDITDGRLVEVWRQELDDGFVGAFAVSPDRTRLAVGTSLGTAHVWDLDDGRPVRRFQLEGELSGLAFLPDGRELLACTNQGRAWRLPADPPRDVVSVASFVYPVVLDEVGGMILAGSWDGNEGLSGAARLWDLATGAPIASYGEEGDVVYAADLSPDGRHAVLGVVRGGWDCSTRVLDLATGEVARRGPYLRGKPARVTVHPDGRRVLSSFSSGLAVVWNLADGALLWSSDQGDPSGEAITRQSGTGVSASALSDDGRWMALAHEGTAIRLVDAHTYDEVRRWPAHDDTIWSLAFSPDGRWLLSTSTDDTVGVWDPATGASVARLVGHGADVFAATASPDGTRIATGGRDRLLRFWDTERFENVASLPGHSSYLYALAWSVDGARLVSGGGDGDVRIWELHGDGVRARLVRERDAMLPHLDQRVTRAFAEADGPVAARQALLGDPRLTDRERQVALQLATARAMAAAESRRRDQGVDARDPRFGGPMPSASVPVVLSYGSFEMAVEADVTR